MTNLNSNNDGGRAVRVRFAPSPTGTLHIGSARTALYNYLFARHAGGTLVLRSEDTDEARSSQEFEQSIAADLAWLGLEWDEGPEVGGPHGPYRQSERVAAGIYRQAAERLLEQGQAYYCFCSQERLEEIKRQALARGEMPKYDRCCAHLSPAESQERAAAGEAATIRFRIPEQQEIVVPDVIHGNTVFTSEVLGDFIIIRSDGGVSYNFAVVVDDAAMEITHVIRGEDHLTNTARQILVFQALGQEPPVYAHHSLIMGPDGGKLSKRHGATSVGDFRRQGYLAAAIINYLALLSWSPPDEREQLSKEEMVTHFDLGRVSKSPAIFDIQKLNWLNGLYIRALDQAGLSAALEPFVRQAPAAATEAQLAVAQAAVQTSLVTLADAEEQIAAFFAEIPWQETGGLAEFEDGQIVEVLDKALVWATRLDDAEEYNLAAVDQVLAAAKELLGSFKKECQADGIPPKRVFKTLRLALSGKGSGPELYFLLAGLGREEVRRRLAAAREAILAQKKQA